MKEGSPSNVKNMFQVFSPKGHLKMHMELIHEGIKPIKCAKCVSSFSQPGGFNRHIESIHDF